MTSVSTPEAATRRRVLFVFVSQGLAGLALMLWLTATGHPQTLGILNKLGPDAAILIVIFAVFGVCLALLKFELTDVIYVSLAMMAYMAMIPLLGAVLTSWLVVLIAITTRLIAMRQIGPVKISMADSRLEYAKTLGLFGTYGIPVIAATWVYKSIGGELPVRHASLGMASKVAVACVVMIVTNNMIMYRPQRAYGYSFSRIVRLDLLDSSIYLLTVPCVVVTSLAYATLGWWAVLALAFTGVVANLVARNLAVTRMKSREQLQRLASLTNIGKTISLRYTTDQLLMAIYTECKKVIDCSLFAIALLDEATN